MRRVHSSHSLHGETGGHGSHFIVTKKPYYPESPAEPAALPVRD